MLDKFDRFINYLRVSVTDRCNQCCRYCMSNEEINFVKSDKILSFEEILEVILKAVEFGFDKVRLTGGEPLTRKNITELVKMISEVDGIKDLSMTTNGVLLEEYAEKLRKAGLGRLNVSLDTMDPVRYSYITGGGDINKVLSGLKVAKEAGFEIIKLNCVIIDDCSRNKDSHEVAKYAEFNNFNVRFIKMMDMEKGKFWPVEGGDGGKCDICNRLRLSSDGRIYPCLFSDQYYSIMDYGIAEALKRAVLYKPLSGHKACNKFYKLGG